MASKQEYKEIIERKLSAESEENQEKTSLGGTGDSGVDSVSTKDKYD